jgi:hypothetical protein
MTAVDEAMRRPVNRNGNEPGIVSVRVIWRGVAA